MLSKARPKFFFQKISTVQKTLKKFTSLCAKPSEYWCFPEKIGGSTEKKHIFAEKKA